ncbi:MAG: LamB/YcsF family protein [Proteobacteria bacterium]|nr:LamB/YcsF family protein [Pseudomonadota bacterium]MDA1063699.1 LamB/YcsF family protein [Pseudomonadota bacterium]
MATIDLNADLGEGDAYDQELLHVVSSCNIAFGGHAGDPASMQVTAQLASARGVAIGAHPGYPDVAGFGRRKAFLIGAELQKSIMYQIDTLARIVRDMGGALSHVKPHGALYWDATQDESVAELFVAATRAAASGTAIVGPPRSALQQYASKAGLRFIAEAFVDRAYRSDGTLVPRGEPGAVHANINTITAQTVSLTCEGRVTAQNGAVIPVAAATLCLHGDTPGADVAARAVRDVLQANGVRIRAPH